MARWAIAVFSWKGGVGKSTLARELAYCVDRIYNRRTVVVDCDRIGVQDLMEDAIDTISGKGDKLPSVGEIKGKKGTEIDLAIYDFAGSMDERCYEIMDKFELVIIPYTPSSYSTQPTCDSAAKVWRLNRDIMFIANMLRYDKDLDETRGQLMDGLVRADPAFADANIEFMPVHFSTGLQTAENAGSSIFKLSGESKINERNYRKICSELNSIAWYINDILDIAEKGVVKKKDAQ